MLLGQDWKLGALNQSTCMAWSKNASYIVWWGSFLSLQILRALLYKRSATYNLASPSCHPLLVGVTEKVAPHVPIPVAIRVQDCLLERQLSGLCPSDDGNHFP